MADSVFTGLVQIEAAIDNEYFEGPAYLYSARNPRANGGDRSSTNSDHIDSHIYGTLDAIRAAVGADARIYCWELADEPTIDGEDVYHPCDLGPECSGPILVSYVADGLYSAAPYEFWDC
jgi:hypothetical protein